VVIVTAYTKRYERFAQAQRKAVKALGYKSLTRSLDASEERETYPFSPYKPTILRQTRESHPEELLVWMDADAFPVRRFDTRNHYDIGVTVRREDSPDGKVNAGVVFVRPTPRAESFLREWEERVRNASPPSDQEVLNEMYEDPGRYRIASFPCEEFNNYYFDETTKDAAIIHVKARRKFRDPEFYAKIFERYGP
jgi:hypothetical protein